MKLPEGINDFFRLSGQDRKAGIYLILIILFFLLLPFIFQWIRKDRELTTIQLKEFLKIPDSVILSKDKDRMIALDKKKIVNQDIQKSPKIERLDINTTDSLILSSIPGISRPLASRIVKYRDLLGGYLSKEQLEEVYGMNSFALNKLYQCVFVRPGNQELLDLDSMSFRRLLRHPYLSYDDVKWIFKLRSRDSADKLRVEDLFRKDVFDSLKVKKLSPYIKK